jgi:hypothetical protein
MSDDKVKAPQVACGMCGAEAESHPWVGVGIKGPEEALAEALKAKLPGEDDSTLAARLAKAVKEQGTVRTKTPVCDLCHKDPEHRKVKLKVHFFAAPKADAAVAAPVDGNLSTSEAVSSTEI